MKQARKTNFFPSVVLGLVDQGVIMITPASSQIRAAGMALPEALGPIIARTLFWLMSFWAAAAADSALSSLSSINSLMGYFRSPTLRPPAWFTWATRSSAAFWHESPTVGLLPVSSALTPTRISLASWEPQPQVRPRLINRMATVHLGRIMGHSFRF